MVAAFITQVRQSRQFCRAIAPVLTYDRAALITEVADGVHRIESVFGGRLLYVYLLIGEDASILVDSGASVTAQETLLGALERLGVDPTLLLVTHPDLDHQGGNSAVRRAYPGTQVACGAGDEAQVADPRTLVARRYSAFEYDHGVGFPTEAKPNLVRLAGSIPVAVDRVFCGGERLRLGPDWTVEILHLPGHSSGHLGVLDPRSKSAVVADAAHGSDYPHADGSPWALMPTYYHLEPYLRTAEDLRALELDAVHSAHWPVAEKGGVSERLDETVAYALRADRLVFELVEGGRSTLRDLMDEALPLLGEWSRSTIGDFACSVHAHLERFADAGLVEAHTDDGMLHYRAVQEYQPPHTGEVQ